MTGGILRGRAQGNVFNFADATTELQNQDSAMGKVYVYTTHGDPHTSKPYMTMKHEVTTDLAPVLEDLATRYSPVRSKFINLMLWKKLNVF
jgi:hypothetical protein